ncbi:MAG TPA: hypothetical protein VE997_06595, partial [Candidatus Limnocylindria bacterium]|nr:hypothetical protein [Candidatus Limnocylindria bacterium]
MNLEADVLLKQIERMLRRPEAVTDGRTGRGAGPPEARLCAGPRPPAESRPPEPAQRSAGGGPAPRATDARSAPALRDDGADRL